MINEQLWREAERLAARPYGISYEVDTLSNGQRVILLRHPDLPAVKAQGIDLDEAKRNLDEARVDYIYSLLDDGIPVPAPATSSSTGSPANGKVWNISGSHKDEIESALDRVITPMGREFVIDWSFGGDFVKQG